MTKQIIVSKGNPYQLGVTPVGKGAYNFAANLRCQKECGVIIYEKNDAEGETLAFAERKIPFPKENCIGKVRFMQLSGMEEESFFYNFYADDAVVPDPYARALSGNESWGQICRPEYQCIASAPDRMMKTEQKADFDWGKDRPLKTPWTDSLLYQLHVRGFTKHISSGVKYKGTFAGLAEKIPYLKSLGVTAIELLPAYEFSEVEERTGQINYWGFKKGFYFVPKASYCSTKQPELEFKRMVKVLHENGIEVILQFYFPKETAQNFIVDVIRYWVGEYHIDGAHLMGERIPALALAADPMLADTKLIYYDFPVWDIYGEQSIYDGGAAFQSGAESGPMPYKNLACCRDDFLYGMRSFLKGDEGSLGNALYHLKNQPEKMGVVNYIANYEGFCLTDMVSYQERHNEANGEENQDGNSWNASWNCGEEGETKKKEVISLREKQLCNAVLLLLFAQGTPMIAAGDEFLHSKGGNNNAWCQDNEVNWLNWRLAKKNEEFLEFVKAAVALRKSNPVFHMPDETAGNFGAEGFPAVSWHGREAWQLSVDEETREAGIMYCQPADGNGEEPAFFYIAYNMHWEERPLALPFLKSGLQWEKIMDTAEGRTVPAGEGINEKVISVPGRSIQILRSVKLMKEGQ